MSMLSGMFYLVSSCLDYTLELWLVKVNLVFLLLLRWVTCYRRWVLSLVTRSAIYWNVHHSNGLSPQQFASRTSWHLPVGNYSSWCACYGHCCHQQKQSQISFLLVYVRYRSEPDSLMGFVRDSGWKAAKILLLNVPWCRLYNSLPSLVFLSSSLPKYLI